MIKHDNPGPDEFKSQCFKRSMANQVSGPIIAHVKVFMRVVELITIDVMDDLTRLCVGNNPMNRIASVCHGVLTTHRKVALPINVSWLTLGTFLVSIKRVAVQFPHLVVRIAKPACHYLPVAMLAKRLHPLWQLVRAVTLKPLVVHQANAVSSVFSSAAFNRAGSHNVFPPCWYCTTTQGSVLIGNAVTVNVAEWIGRRIVEATR
jgi:hypothetical protein